MNQSDPEILGPEQAQQLIKELRARQVEIETQNAELRGRLRALEATGPQPAQVLCEPNAQGPDLMARSQTEIALPENEKTFRTMVEILPLAIYQTVGVEQRSEYVNATMSTLFGYTQEDIPTIEHWWPLAYPDAGYRRQIAEEWTARVERAIATQTPIAPMETVVTCKDGSQKDVLWGYVPHGDKNYAYGLDVTERKQPAKPPGKSQELLSLLLRHSPIYVFIKEVTPTASVILQASANFQEMLGMPGGDLVGKAMSDLFPAELAAKMTVDDWGVVSRGEVFRGDEEFKGRHYTSIKFPITLEGKTLLAGCTIDITEVKELQEQLRHRADTDPLTGITNRRRFLELAHTEIRRSRRLGHALALAVIDIDDFKGINDAYGHAGGDLALLTMTRTCRQHIREIDIFARLGGDEFVLLLPETSREHAHAAMTRLCLALASTPVDLDGRRVMITISVGLAGLAPGDASLITLLKRADEALYRAKAAGRNRVMVESAAE